MAVVGIFGAVRFGRVLGGFSTFHQITSHQAGRFHGHNIHLRKPLSEWTGNDLVEVELTLTLNAAWSGDPNRMLSLLHLYQASEPPFVAPLVLGGKPMAPPPSLFVLQSIDETHEHWLKGGQLIHAEVTLHFQEYIAFTEGLPGLAGALAAFGGLR
jgi:Phage P2 GpU